jgi:short-subunit dehydrogenase involved in D-alanine esterification of teichoic acids
VYESNINPIFRKGDMLDVERESEYKELVSKINKYQYTKVNIIVNVEDIKKRCPIDVH